MEKLIDLPNITPQSIVIDDTKNEVFSNSTFDVKNYLNTKLAKGETEKTLTIRLLPMDLKTGSPFAKVYIHRVRVPQEMVNPGEKPYKSYICLSKNTDIDHEKFGHKCPYCEMNRAAYKESTQTDDVNKKKMLQKLSLSNLAQEAVIVRCIERGKEDEGVKFWRFTIRNDKTDPYNQILKLYNLRKEAAEKKNKTENILDIYEGRDLNVTITAEGTSAPTIVDDSDRSPLSEDEEKMKQWIFDPKKWQDVFTCKPYDYLNIVSQMMVPWYDKSKGCWVSKDEYESEHAQQKQKAQDDIADAKQEVVKLASQAMQEEVKTSFMSNLVDDDLPL